MAIENFELDSFWNTEKVKRKPVLYFPQSLHELIKFSRS